DYRERWAELESSSNPFAIIVSAYLKTLETEGNVQERYTWKKRFLLELYQRGIKRDKIWTIYKFVDWMMILPKEMNNELFAEIKAIEEVKKMPYITTAERIGMEKMGQQAIATILEIKFGEAGQRFSERAYKMDNVEALQKLMAELKHAQSLADAEKLFDELELPTA
ncbi:MAG: hypothetical protein ACRENG_10695, partial [bacterium]